MDSKQNRTNQNKQVTPDMTQENTSETPKLSKAQRIVAYLHKLEGLKERSALREVLEKELLLEFVKTNRGNINEFPLLKSQQKTIIDLVCTRSEHPAYDYVRKITEKFVILLGRYAKVKDGKDKELIDDLERRLSNIEAQLIRCVQGIIYAMALIADNFEELVLKYFGKASLGEYNALVEKHPINHTFWTAFHKNFIAKNTEKAFGEIVFRKKYTLGKDGNMLTILFPFDEVLSGLDRETGVIEKTKAQISYAESESLEKFQNVVKTVKDCLLQGLSFMPGGHLPEEELDVVSRLACIDPSIMDFIDEYHKAHENVEKSQGKDSECTIEESEKFRRELKFITSQIVASGVGSILAIDETKNGLLFAMKDLNKEEADVLQNLIGYFDLHALEKTILFLFESSFVYLLRKKGAEEGGKLAVRAQRARRTDIESVKALYSMNMNKIRQKKIWATDGSRSDTLLFRTRDANQLSALMTILQLEGDLSEKISRLWSKGTDRVDITLRVNLKLLAKTTTNLKAKLNEILALYDIVKLEK